MDLKTLTEVNQICKNLRIDNSYTIFNGECLIFDRRFIIDNKTKKFKEDVGYRRVVFHDKKIDSDTLSKFNIYVKSGKELYSFINTYKKQITGIYDDDEKIRINTSYNIEDFEFTIEKILEENKKHNDIRFKDIDNYREYIKKMKQYKFITEGIITEEIYDIIMNLENQVYLLNLNGKRLRTTSRLLNGIKKDREIKYKLYEVDENQNCYVVIFDGGTKSYTIEHIYKFISY